MRLVISESAQQDIDKIFDYWADRVSFTVAERIWDGILDRFRLLARFPHAGRKWDEFGADIYRLTAGQYLIYYQLKSNRVEIVRVIHGARDQGLAFSKK
jgi:toxin ParE1/3/4